MTDTSSTPENEDDQRSPVGEPADPLSPSAGIAPEVSRRVSSILDAVESEAGRLRGEAVDEAQRYLDFSRRRADELVVERQRRIAELSDEIIAKAEAVVGRLEDAAPVREGFDNLVRALGDAAERLAAEAEADAHSFQAPAFHDEAVAAYEPPPAPVAPPAQAPPAAEAPPLAPGQDVDPDVETYQPYPPPGEQPPYGETQVYGEPPASVYGDPAYGDPAYGQPPIPGAYPPQSPAAGEDWQGVDDARLVGIQMAAAGRTRGQVREHLHNQMGLGETREILDEIFGPGSPEDARVPWTAFGR